MYKKSFLAFTAALMLGLGTLPARAADITMTISATLDSPALSGSDPLGAAGGTGTITITIRKTLKPTAHTARSATYRLAAGTVTATVDGDTVTNPSPFTMKISFPAAGPDTLVLSGKVSEDGVTVPISATASLAKGSFTKAVLKHPQAFTPSTQNLTAPTTYPGPGSTLSYTLFGSKTVLGVTGTATD